MLVGQYDLQGLILFHFFTMTSPEEEDANDCIESDEGLYCSECQHGGPQQRCSISRDRHLIPGAMSETNPNHNFFPYHEYGAGKETTA